MTKAQAVDLAALLLWTLICYWTGYRMGIDSGRTEARAELSSLQQQAYETLEFARPEVDRLDGVTHRLELRAEALDDQLRRLGK